MRVLTAALLCVLLSTSSLVGQAPLDACFEVRWSGSLGTAFRAFCLNRASNEVALLRWDFGDGCGQEDSHRNCIVTGCQPRNEECTDIDTLSMDALHHYSDAGLYLVTLEVEDIFGQTDSISIPIDARKSVNIIRRGDVNDDGAVNMTDPILVLRQLFGRPRSDLGCFGPAADANGDNRVEVNDAILLLRYLFLGRQAPADPGPSDCGPTTDLIWSGCNYSSC